jgi:3',5'-cyclic AMP phosphodiesterase CpdA
MFNRGVLEKGIEQINELEPDIVVITGDLTEWGLELEFRGVKEYLKEIKQPCFIVP